MAIEGVSDFITTNSIKESAAKQNNDLSMDDFLQLMIAQLQNQDMFSPMDNSQFVAQMAQFSMVNALMGMSELSNLTYTTSLIGKMATVAFLDGGTIASDEGIIESVNLYNGSAEVVINGMPYQLSNIMSLGDVVTPVEGGDKLTDYAALIGKNAALMYAAQDSGIEDISGRISGIRLIDGKVHVIINDRVYPLSAINTLNEIVEQAPTDKTENNTGVEANKPDDAVESGEGDGDV